MECENEVYSECKMLKEKKEREEYLEKLKKWLDEARLWRYNIYSGFQWNFDENFRENSSQTSNTFFSNANQDNLQYALQQRLLFLANRNYQNTLFQTGK